MKEYLHRAASAVALVFLAMALLTGCETIASGYRSPSLRISAVPNANSARLAEAQAPKIENELNRAFINDGRFANGTGLFLSIEIAAFSEPRAVGAQQSVDQFGNRYSYLPGTLVVSARWYDEKQKPLEQVNYQEVIQPLAEEVSSYPALNRAIVRVCERIVDHTTDRYLASK